MAPELMYPSKFSLQSPRISREADVYAFGMAMYEVVMGVRPFGLEGMKHDELIFVVMEGERPMKPDDVETVGFGNGLWDLVEKCWSQDRTQRPSTLDVRLRLKVAASMAPTVPPGPRIRTSLARSMRTSATVSNSHRKQSAP